MDQPYQTEPCLLLEKIPPELRLHIYGYVWEDPMYCRVTVAREAVRCKLRAPLITANHIQPQSTALVKTCKTIHDEATPVLYSNFTLFLRLVGMDPSFPIGGDQTLGQCLFLRHIQHVSLRTWCQGVEKVPLRLSTLQTLCELLETAGANVKTLQVTAFGIYYTLGLEREKHPAVQEQYHEIIQNLLESRNETTMRDGLFKRLLETLMDTPSRTNIPCEG